MITLHSRKSIDPTQKQLSKPRKRTKANSYQPAKGQRIATITQSGLNTTPDGIAFLVTQGSVGYNLIAGKQCLIRVFTTTANLQQASAAVMTIAGVGQASAIIVPSANWIAEVAPPQGPSVGIIVRGFAFARPGVYQINVILISNSGLTLANVFAELSFRSTRDLRLVIVPLQGSGPNRGFLPTPAWYDDIRAAMRRLGSMLPVRDCVHSGLNHGAAGLRYHVAQPMEGWPCEVNAGPQDYFAEINQINASAGPNDDTADVNVLYRPVQPLLNEQPGGNANYCGTPRRPQCIGGQWAGIEMTAPCMAQEIGHTFCLEPSGSPHYEDPSNPKHSKDPQIVDVFAFDFVRRVPYDPPSAPALFLGDVMNNLGDGVWQGANSVLYNVYDWNWLADQFSQLNSTGPDVNPSDRDPCPPLQLDERPVHHVSPRTPAQWTRVIGNPVGGKTWVWGPNGIVPVPPPRPDDLSPAMKVIGRWLREFERRGVKHVYMPLEQEVFTIASRILRSTMHGHHNFRIGGIDGPPVPTESHAPRNQTNRRKNTD
jgi:hypothetical protein